MSPNARMDWAKGLDFEVKQVGTDVEDLDEVDWLFWVGCAGAYEDRAKKTTRAVAELLDLAGVSFAVLGNGETCTGDPARRSGNEFVFQQLAMQNAEVFKEAKVKKVVSTCAHCFNTLKNEYAEFGVELEVVHHTQLLNRLVREGKLTPVAAEPSVAEEVDHLPRPVLPRPAQPGLLPARASCSPCIPNAELAEMPRNSERSFCCGAGGARMWMEEKIGERINLNRTTEAVEHRRRPDRGRLPVLPGDAVRRPHLAAGRRQGPRGGRGARRRPDAARLGQAPRGPGTARLRPTLLRRSPSRRRPSPRRVT